MQFHEDHSRRNLCKIAKKMQNMPDKAGRQAGPGMFRHFLLFCDTGADKSVYYSRKIRQLTIPRSRSCSCSECQASAHPPPSHKIWKIEIKSQMISFKLRSVHLHWHPSSEDGCHSKVTSMPKFSISSTSLNWVNYRGLYIHGSDKSYIAWPGIARRHHILGVEHLLGQFRNSQRPAFQV